MTNSCTLSSSCSAWNRAVDHARWLHESSLKASCKNSTWAGSCASRALFFAVFVCSSHSYLNASADMSGLVLSTCPCESTTRMSVLRRSVLSKGPICILAPSQTAAMEGICR